MQMGGFGKSNHAGFAINPTAEFRQPPWAPSFGSNENPALPATAGYPEAQPTLGVPNSSLEPGDTIRPTTQSSVPSNVSETNASPSHDDAASTNSPEEEHGELPPPSPTLRISSGSPITYRSPSRQESSDPTPSTPQRRIPTRGPSPAPSPLGGYAFPALDPPSSAVPPLPTSAQGHQRLPALNSGATSLAPRHLTGTHAPFTRSLTSPATPELLQPQPAPTTSPSSSSLSRPTIVRQASVPLTEGTLAGPRINTAVLGTSSLPASAVGSPRQAPARSQTQMTTLAPVQPLATRGYKGELESGAVTPNPSTPNTVRPARRVPSPSGRAHLRVSILLASSVLHVECF